MKRINFYVRENFFIFSREKIYIGDRIFFRKSTSLFIRNTFVYKIHILKFTRGDRIDLTYFMCVLLFLFSLIHVDLLENSIII